MGGWVCEKNLCQPECADYDKDTCTPAGGECVGFNPGSECPEGYVNPDNPLIHCAGEGAMCCVPAKDNYKSCVDTVRDCPDFAPIKCIGYWFCDEKVGDDCNYVCGESPPCPGISPPPPGWCDDGVVVDGGHDGFGCELPPKCLPYDECFSGDAECGNNQYCDFCIHPETMLPVVAGICRPLSDAAPGCKNDLDCEFGMKCETMYYSGSEFGWNRDECNTPLPEKTCQIMIK